MTMALSGNLVLGLVCGLVIGGLHMLWLARAASRLGTQSVGLSALLSGAALRLTVMLAGFALLAWAAPMPAPALIAALAGFTLARGVGLRRARRMDR